MVHEKEENPVFKVGELVDVLAWEGQIREWGYPSNFDFSKPREIKEIDRRDDTVLIYDDKDMSAWIPFSQLLRPETTVAGLADLSDAMRIGAEVGRRMREALVGITRADGETEKEFKKRLSTETTYSGEAILTDGRPWIIPDPDPREGWRLDNVCKDTKTGDCDDLVDSHSIIHEEGRRALNEKIDGIYVYDQLYENGFNTIKTWTRPICAAYDEHAAKHPDVQKAIKEYPFRDGEDDQPCEAVTTEPGVSIEQAVRNHPPDWTDKPCEAVATEQGMSTADAVKRWPVGEYGSTRGVWG